MAETKTDQNGMIKPGDVLINKVELTTLGGGLLDLKPFIVEINIFEDMFSPSMSGNIIIRDAQNLIGKLPIVGDEILTIDIQTPGFGEPGKYDNINKIQKSFCVYSVKDRKLNNDREQFYALSFCSLEAALDNVTRVSQKFSGTTDEIASEVFETFMKAPRFFKSKLVDYKEGANSEFVISDVPHESKITFTSPMWTPMQIMNWIAKRAIGNKHKTPTYLFYETTKGFYFTSIEENIAVQLENKLIYSDFIYNTPLVDTTTEESVSKGYATVEAVKFLTNLDVLQSQDLGHFASSVFKFDLIKKEHEIYIYDHGFNFNGDSATPTAHMESYKVEGDTIVRDDTKKYNMIFPITVMRSYNSKTFMNTVNPGVLGSTEDSIDLHPEKYVGQRNSSLMDVSTLKMVITVPGRTDCEAGKLIRFFYPSVGDKNEETIKTEGGLWDPFISGIFMISAIHHHITPFHHNMYMEIVKDSYANPILEVTETETQQETTTPSPGSTPTPSPTTTSGNATPAAVGSKLFVFGDSIGVGVQSVGKAAGSAHGGDSPRTVYNAITSYLKTNNVKGATILLSSGASNGAAFEVEGGKTTPQREFEFIAKQISALKAAGASKVILLGTASGYSTWFPGTKFTNNKKYRVDLRGVNNQLSQIASGNGAEFTGPLEQFDDLKNDGLHPYGGYSKIWKKYSGSK